MKSILPLICYASLMISSTGFSQEIIWGGPGSVDGEFENGLNNWTTQGLNSSDSTLSENAVWTHKANGKADDGAFWGDRNSINSLSANNGAAVFDSDFLDSDGDPGSLGWGDCPGPHKGVLTSPLIDCSAHNSVAVHFTQFYRNFESKTSIEVSNDGGINWTEFIINSDIDKYQSSSNGENRTVNISSVAAGKDAVQFRFVFDGYYYFWILDDVSLSTIPDNDLEIGYTYYPPSNFKTPRLHTYRDTFFFGCEISNSGKKDQLNAVLKASIINASTGQVIHEDSILIDIVPAGTENQLYLIPDYFLPLNKLKPAVYLIQYSIYTDQVDALPANNSKSKNFIISDFIFSKSANVSEKLRPQGWGTYAVGNYYKLNSDPTILTTALQSRFSCSVAPPAVLDQLITEVFLFEVHCADDFSDFQGTEYFGFEASDELQLIGVASYQFTKADGNKAEILIDLLDLEGNPGVKLKPGGKYFIVNQYDGLANNTMVYHMFDRQIDYAYKPAISPLWIENEGQWRLNGFGPDYAAHQELIVDISGDIICANDEQKKVLAESALQFFPNPVLDKMSVSCDIPAGDQGWLHIADQSGKVIRIEQVKPGLQPILLDLNHLAEGSYFLHLSTQEGNRTLPFAIIR